MLKSKLAIILIVFVTGSQAQVVNIEGRRNYDHNGWFGTIDAGFSVVQNKNLLLSASFRPKVQYKTRWHYFLFLTDWNYSKGKDQVYANTGMAHFRYAYRLGNHKDTTKLSPWKWESYTQVQYNQLLDQKVRALLGTGIRVKVFGKEKVRLFVGSSGFFEYEELQSSAIFNRNFRWSNYMSWNICPNEHFLFSGAFYIQPRFDRFTDYRVMGQYEMNFKFLKRVDFRIEFTHFFDSEPPANVRSFVFSSSAGFKVRIGQ